MVLQGVHGLYGPVRNGSVWLLNKRKDREVKEGMHAGLQEVSQRLPCDTSVYILWVRT